MQVLALRSRGPSLKSSFVPWELYKCNVCMERLIVVYVVCPGFLFAIGPNY